MSTHTQLPWVVYEDAARIAGPAEINEAQATYGTYKTASLTDDRGYFYNPYDPSFIVLAANNHHGMLMALAGCAEALHECAAMLRQLECPGHAAVADIHQEAARAAIAKAKGK